MQPYEKYLKENSQKLRVDQTEKPANVMFAGFFSIYPQNFLHLYTTNNLPLRAGCFQ